MSPEDIAKLEKDVAGLFAEYERARRFTEGCLLKWHKYKSRLEEEKKCIELHGKVRKELEAEIRKEMQQTQTAP